jgi:phospholipase C
MDGFVRQAEAAPHKCANPDNPACTNGDHTDVTGYHDAREIPNYWRYAQDFVLQDRMFEPNASWSLPAHLFMVSAWSARCETDDPMSCRNELENPSGIRPKRRVHPLPQGRPPDDVTYLLHEERFLAVLRRRGHSTRLRRRRHRVQLVRRSARRRLEPFPWFEPCADSREHQTIDHSPRGCEGTDRSRPSPDRSERQVSEHPPARVGDGTPPSPP